MITEMDYTVNKQGSLKVPKDAIREMGLQAGDHVRVAFLSTDGVKNDFCELMLYGEATEEETELAEQALQIPESLMKASNLTNTENLRILCLDHALLICPDTSLSGEELQAVLDSLLRASDLVSELPDDTEEIRDQLDNLIEELEEEAHNYEWYE